MKRPWAAPHYLWMHGRYRLEPALEASASVVPVAGGNRPSGWGDRNVESWAPADAGMLVKDTACRFVDC